MTKFLKSLLIIPVVLIVLFLILLIIIGIYTEDPLGKFKFGILANMNVPPYPNSSNSWSSTAESSAYAGIGPSLVQVYGQRIVFNTTDSAEKVASYYEDVLSSKGWKILGELNGTEGLYGNYTRGYVTVFEKKIFILGTMEIKVEACDFIEPSGQNLTKVQLYELNAAKARCSWQSIKLRVI